MRESTGKEGGVSLFMASNSDNVLADSIKSSSFKVGFGVVGKSFFIEGGLEILQSKSIIENNTVVESLTFEDR